MTTLMDLLDKHPDATILIIILLFLLAIAVTWSLERVGVAFGHALGSRLQKKDPLKETP